MHYFKNQATGISSEDTININTLICEFTIYNSYLLSFYIQAVSFTNLVITFLK